MLNVIHFEFEHYLLRLEVNAGILQFSGKGVNSSNRGIFKAARIFDYVASVI